MMRILILLVLTTALTGCAELFLDRTYTEEMENDPDNFFVAEDDFPMIPGDSGKAYRSKRDVLSRTPSSVLAVKKEKANQELENELQIKLEKLSDSEYARFIENSKYLPTLSEQIYYLDLPKRKQKEYMAEKKIGENYEQNEAKSVLDFVELRESRELKEQKTIMVGMTKNQVLDLLGNPVKVEVAGNPSRENERWTFIENNSPTRIYFENGLVEGWKLDP